jgi:AcrR family transcriptional regulator
MTTERAYHHGNLRQALLEAAERTVRERGAGDLSLRELAREVGVSHGAPRRHFPDRQALLDSLAEAGFERLRHELREAHQDAGPGFVDRLHAMAAAYVRFAIDDSALLELMFAGKHREGATALEQAAEQAFAPILELIAQGQAEQFLDPGEPEGVALILFATVQGIASLVTAGMVQSDQVDGLLADSIAHFLRGSRLHTVANPGGAR